MNCASGIEYFLLGFIVGGCLVAIGYLISECYYR